MNIFISNLSYQVVESDLQELFENYGAVDTAKVITDRESGRSRGFAFVEMPNEEEAKAAIAALDGQEFKQRTLKVSEAQPREDRPRNGGNFQRREGNGRRENNW